MGVGKDGLPPVAGISEMAVRWPTYERIDAQARGGQGGNSRGGTDTSTFQTRALDFRVAAVGSKELRYANTLRAELARSKISSQRIRRLKRRRKAERGVTTAVG